jgi:transglutaminase-like putative cysteine protease
MKFRITSILNYNVSEPSTVILNIHPSFQNQQLLYESFLVAGVHQTSELKSDKEGNRLIRTTVDTPGALNYSYSGVVDNNWQTINFENLGEMQVFDFPPEILTYLYPSRYCQSDKLFRFANHQFGNIDNPFEKVLAITNWIHKNVEYLSGSTNAETSAYDTVTQQAGVCRDFAHLGIALCRALTIPARYCSAYAYQLTPQDFHACFEVYLAGHWVLFDATKLAPLNGLVRIAVGRDAADTAIANIFGNITLDSMTVDSQLAEGVLTPFHYESGKFDGICYDAPVTIST